eukprot:CAMPEP_0183306254 /NCGR_PEP_ID=MMETSP0160_2-20130417/10742_1 /TAXON_ID=2839 ORGANISM="Odontella Sinensis, Strain Grunow 1884" /NCGR_SAMPLE_ID=MMETSP0160_2 /ASSEMBLY_ACC=CAM_ASM_000250 /LENGTH=53 /DNA_ID=CAMNT_0025469597 /DNA_START=313 /DNA_END=470 /DNA_ORIENTATION=+
MPRTRRSTQRAAHRLTDADEDKDEDEDVTRPHPGAVVLQVAAAANQEVVSAVA